MPQPLLIDCDPGTDDAVALLLAFAAADLLDIRAVTTVGGNVDLATTTANACRLRTLAGREDVPVAAGCPGPILRRLETATHVHGTDGLGGVALAPAATSADPRHAVDLMVETVRATPGITIAALGPLTNLAVALVKAPDIAARIGAIVFMGGAIGRGNVTSSAEFNVHADPHAAAVVLASGVGATMIGLDVTHQVIAHCARIAALRRSGTRAAGVVADIMTTGFARTGGAGAAMHDPCVIAYLMAPRLFAGRAAQVAVETASALTLGRTAVDWKAEKPNCHVLETVDADGFFALLIDRLGRS
ncbi:MAG: nucleoside hydrolase [Alphaproteobacteria bacterium]|nr:nucleoside hydrolase [Alphaproteobacteria bacterium]